MPRDKERSINPAQQQRKLEKAKALKKSRAELQTRRNEKLAKRNPERIQRQIDDLKALEASGDIKTREKAILEELERDLKAVRKAKEILGEKVSTSAPYNRRQEGHNETVLGKRAFDGARRYPSHSGYGRHDSSGSDTDESVRRIPMPEDTPPPIPREFRRGNTAGISQQHTSDTVKAAQDTNNTLQNQRLSAIESKTTYSSAPQLRDLKREAVSRFIPSVVRKRQEAVRGEGGQLLEPEELDRLEAAGYGKQSTSMTEAARTIPAQNDDNDYNYRNDTTFQRLDEEERCYQQELNLREASEYASRDSGRSRPLRVEIEEVEDEMS